MNRMEREANARLIAAVSDLLEGCEKLLEWVNNLGQMVGEDALIDAMPNNFGRQVAMRTIEKAKKEWLEQRLIMIKGERDFWALALVRQFQKGVFEQAEFCQKILEVGEWAEATLSDLKEVTDG